MVSTASWEIWLISTKTLINYVDNLCIFYMKSINYDTKSLNYYRAVICNVVMWRLVHSSIKMSTRQDVMAMCLSNTLRL